MVIQSLKATGTETALKSDTLNGQIALASKSAVKGEKYVSANSAVSDLIAPSVDLTRTKIWVSQPAGQKDKIVMVEAYLSPDTQTAEVSFENIIINLNQDQNIIGKWTGSLIIPDEKVEQTFSPVILATLTASDSSGNVSNTDINWSNYEEIKPSLVSQYLFIKNSSSGAVKTLVGASRIYFTLLLVACLVALLINLFIGIKKKHAHIIASALGLIILLILLIVI